jgi:hypothetical protein
MRNNPPSVDVWSGAALNTLLRNIQDAYTQFGTGPSIPIDPDVLARISVTDGTSFGQGILREGPMLSWPYAFRSFDFFDAGRQRMETAMSEAIRQTTAQKQTDAKLIDELLAALDGLRTTLREHVHDLTPSQGIQARRYLNDLQETIRTLQSPTAVQFATGKWAARGETVSDVVMNLSRDGLRFAPAAAGNESAYNTLFQLMLQYDRALDQFALESSLP